MLSCRQVSYLASKRLDQSLSWQEKLQFKFHVAICGQCRRYAVEVKLLQQKVKQSIVLLLTSSEGLSSEAKQRIQKQLDNALD